MNYMPDDTPPPSANAGPAVSESQPGAFALFKSLSQKTGTFLKDATAKTAETVKGGTKNINATSLRSFGASAGEQMHKLGSRAAEGGAYVWKTTRSTTDAMIGHFYETGSTITVQCQREAKEAPCPRVLLVCCTALCSGALASEGLFTTETQPELAQHLFLELQDAHFGRLLPAGATPQVITAVIKHWLRTLPEPLLTFKLAPALGCADTPHDALPMVLRELPPVNRNALLVLLETCHRIASNAAINDTDAAALAAALAPCLLWQPAAADGGGAPHEEPGNGQPLDANEAAVFEGLLAHMISNYRSLL